MVNMSLVAGSTGCRLDRLNVYEIERTSTLGSANKNLPDISGTRSN